MTDSIYDIVQHKPANFLSRAQFLDQVRQCLALEELRVIYRKEIQESEEKGDGILGWATRNGYPIDILESLISLGCSLETPSKVPVGRWDSETTTTLHESLSDDDVFAWFMSKGPTDLEVKDSKGLTPLAAMFRHVSDQEKRAVRRDVLLASGANPNATIKQKTSHRESQTLEALGVSPSHQQELPLLLSECVHSADDLVALANAGADLAAISALGQSVLHLNREVGPIVDRVVAAGVDPNGQDIWWNTPLHAQAELSSFSPQGVTRQVMQALVEQGADVEARNGLGQTPLHLAKSLEAVETLLELGANPNARDSYGTTATEELLDELGSSPNITPSLKALLKKHATPDDGLIGRLERAIVSGNIKKIQACFELGGSTVSRQIRNLALRKVEDLSPAKQLSVCRVLSEHLLTGAVTPASRQLAVQIALCQDPATPQFIEQLGSGARKHFEAMDPQYPIMGSALNFNHARRGEGPDWRPHNLRALLKMGCAVRSKDGYGAPTLELRKIYWEAATPEVREELKNYRGYQVIGAEPASKKRSRLNPSM